MNKEKLHQIGFWGGLGGTAVSGPGVWFADRLLGIEEKFDWNEWLALFFAAAFIASLIIEPKKVSGIDPDAQPSQA